MRDGCLYIYKRKSDPYPSNVVFLRGVYIDTVMENGVMGFSLYHENNGQNGFKERLLFDKKKDVIKEWILYFKYEAQYDDINMSYNRL